MDSIIGSLTPVANTSFGWGGRTGGLNAQQNIDSIQFTLFTNSSPLGISEVGPNIVITFQGTLESSTNLSAWTPMVGQTSPLILSKASLTGKTFYRARIPN